MLLWSNQKKKKIKNILFKNKMAEKSASELLIEREEKSFLKRLERELKRMADESIEFSSGGGH